MAQPLKKKSEGRKKWGKGLDNSGNIEGNSNGLFHCAFFTARVRPPSATLLPLEHAPGYTLFAPRHREPPAAPAHEASCWPARSAAGRPPGSAGPAGLLVTGGGPPQATRNRAVGWEGVGFTTASAHGG